jgi:hypothetical protein
MRLGVFVRSLVVSDTRWLGKSFQFSIHYLQFVVNVLHREREQ